MHRFVTTVMAGWLIAAPVAVSQATTQPVVDERGGIESAESGPMPFRARYDARIGVARGTVDMALLPTGSDQADEYAYRSVTKPRGLARLIRSAPLIECTVFQVSSDGDWLAREHQYIDGKPGEGKSSSAVFDAASGIATARYRDREAELPVTSAVYDRMLEGLIASRDLAAGRTPGPYRIVERAELHTVAYERVGEERVATDAGEFDTVIYRRQREGSSRSSLTWFAPELGWLPVRVEQYKRDDRQGVVTLTELDMPAAGALEIRQARGSVTPLCP